MLDLAVALPAVFAAYVIFAIAGFGTALVSAPVLAQIMPVARIVPMLALLDVAAALINGVKLGDKIVKRELAFLVPLMMAGSLCGAWLLFRLPERVMMVSLGVFAAGYGAWSFVAPAPVKRIAQGWVFVFGLVGGVFSAMFGSGGFLYAMYLSRRLEDKDAIRATQSALIACSTFTRVVIFALAGVYADTAILVLAVALVPAMLLGSWAGHRITLRLSKEQFMRVLHGLLVCTGAALLLRAALQS
jgi:hypothetical protein